MFLEFNKNNKGNIQSSKKNTMSEKENFSVNKANCGGWKERNKLYEGIKRQRKWDPKGSKKQKKKEKLS